MSKGEENKKAIKESKFRFLNPEEKNKLREMRKVNSDVVENISFESNVDLSVEFEKNGYSTQRYNIKKIVQKSLSDTQIFDTSLIKELEDAKNNSINNAKEDLEKIEEIEKIEEKWKYIDSEESETDVDADSLEIILIDETEQSKSDDVNDLILFDNIEDEEVINDDFDIEINLVGNDLEKSIKENINVNNIELSENTNIVNEDNGEESIEITVSDRKFVQESDLNRNNRFERDREKKLQAQRFFEDKNEVKELNEIKIKEYLDKVGEFLYNHWAKILIVLIGLFLIIYSMKFIIKQIKGRTEINDGIVTETIIDDEETLNVDKILEDIQPNEVEEKNTKLEHPIDPSEMSTYNAIVEILSANVSCTVLEITNKNFNYVEDSNTTDYFESYVFANLKNAEPKEKTDRYISLFGKNDNAHFGNLKYLTDVDFFNSIYVDYTKNNTTTTYSAIAYYQSEVLDDRVYEKMSNSELAKFLADEVGKSQHKTEVDIKKDSKILTLISYDDEIGAYNILHMVNVN